MGRVVVVDSRQVVPCEAVVGIGVAVVVSLVAFVTEQGCEPVTNCILLFYQACNEWGYC